MTSDGQRVVALAGQVDGCAPRLRALIGFGDPARAGVAEAMATARRAGIHVVVVTGDHPATASAIGRQVALPEGRVALGPEVDGMSDVALAEALPGLAIVARSIPATKERIVRVARAAGHLVAVTGDGVNDAPALHAADVAVAMGTGTAVAKEASDLVLNDDSFATLVYGIEEGRRIVDNVQKGLVFLLSTHVALLGFILIATIAGFSQALLPIQVLWLELFIDLSASWLASLWRAWALGGRSPVWLGPFRLVGTRGPSQEPRMRTQARRRPGAVRRRPDPARPAR